MNAPATIRPEAEPLLKLSTRELLSIIIGCHEALSAKCGPLSNAPSDILEALDKADDAVREAREWLSEAGEHVWPKSGASYGEWNA